MGLDVEGFQVKEEVVQYARYGSDSSKRCLIFPSLFSAAPSVSIQSNTL